MRFCFHVRSKKQGAKDIRVKNGNYESGNLTIFYGKECIYEQAKKLYGIMTLALALSLANTVPVKAVAVDEAFAGVVSASKNTTSTALADAETCTACGKENGYRISRTYNPWQTTGETRNCEHNLVYGLD